MQRLAQCSQPLVATQHAMDHSCLTAYTTDEDPQGLPCAQVFVQSDGQRVWYNLKFVFLAVHGPLQDRKSFLHECLRYWKRCGLTVGQHYFLRSKATPATFVANICTGLGLYWLIAWRAMFARTQALQQTALEFMVAAAVRCQEVGRCFAAEPAGLATIGNLFGRPLLLSGDFKTVSGLRWAADGALNRSDVGAAVALWGKLGFGNWQAPFHDWCDVITFSLLAARAQRSMVQHSFGKRVREWILTLAGLVVESIATLMDACVLGVCLPARSGRALKPAPAYRSPSKPLHPRRVYTQVSPAAIWQFIEKSEATGCSLATYIRGRKEDPEAGGSESQADQWMKKLHWLCVHNRSLGIAGARHLNLVADPSTHSEYETMVSIAWCWEEGVGAIADIQRMPATSKVLKADMPDRIAELWAQNRLERVAT